MRAEPFAFAAGDWRAEIFAALKKQQVRQMAYVPDAGHASLIRACHADSAIDCTVLTTEEEGVALLAGAELGGQRGVMLMQSSGVGNCVNMFSLLKSCGFPFVTLVTMRGEWGEFNPWQVPMGRATQPALEAIGVTVLRANSTDELPAMVAQAATMAFEADQQIAILIGQRLLGEKTW